MGYCFMTVDKIKNFRAMDAKFKHNYRIYDPPNVDPDRRSLNEELVDFNGRSYKDVWDKTIQELKDKGLMKRKVRSDAVLGFEIVTTFSREDFEHVDIEKWKQDNVAWMNENFNKKGADTNNVVSMMYHADESGNVHIHTFVIPINEKGNLNSHDFINGPRDLSRLQSSYGKLMEKNHNLKRGLEGSTAKHEDIKKFYTKLNHAINPDVPKPEKDEEIDDYYTRVKTYTQEKDIVHLQEIKKLERKVVEAETDSKRIILENMDIEREKKKKLKKLNSLFGAMKSYAIENNLTPDDVEKMLKTYSALQSGLKHYEDQEYASNVADGMNKIIHSERKRQKELEKKADEKWAI